MKNRIIMLFDHWRGRVLGVANFIVLFALLNTLMFQWPLYRLAAATRTTLDVRAALDIATLCVFQLMVSITILGLFSLVSIRVLKALCIFLLVGNAVALYFIVQYRVFLDETMVGNIVNTNWREAAGLAHPRLLLYVVLLGLLPAALVWRLPVGAGSRLKRATLIALSLVLGSSWVYANAPSWLWIDRHAKAFGGLVLPWSYVINTARYFKSERERHRVVQLLPAITTSRPGGMMFVLVIGEAARTRNFSLYGYSRDTNPRLAHDGVVVYSGARACATYTTAALRCMLSYRGAAGQSADDEPLPSYLYRNGVEVIWRSNNFGEPPLQVSRYDSAGAIRSACAADCSNLQYDEVLLNGLAALLRDKPDRKTLVVLHQGGSHGPQYFSKYPPAFAAFRPACQSVELQRCRPGELINAYDNTIVYTDAFLHRVIDLLKSVPDRPGAMLYMADHGESLGEGGLYLHGVPMALAPEVQTSVPLVAWVSDDFRRRGGGLKSAAQLSAALSQDLVFHSVMGALGLRSAIYVAGNDLFVFAADGREGR